MDNWTVTPVKYLFDYYFILIVAGINESTNEKDSKSTSNRTTQIKERPVPKNGGNSGKHATSNKTSAKKKAHLEKFFTEEERANSTKRAKSESKSAISTNGKPVTLELEELQKQDTSKRKVRTVLLI